LIYKLRYSRNKETKKKSLVPELYQHSIQEEG